MTVVLVTGASGFIGRHVLRELRRHPDLTLRLLVHQNRPAAGEEAEAVRGDLAHPGSLARACEGVDVLVHAASYIGSDEARAYAVNDAGTGALLECAGKADVGRVVHLSTAAVYGRGPFRAARPEELALAPASALSRSRAAAGEQVLAAGGVVVRPHLVLGPGDRWVLPRILRLRAALGPALDALETRASIIDAASLGSLLAGLALAPRPAGPGTAFHAAFTEPVVVGALTRALAATVGPSAAALRPKGLPSAPGLDASGLRHDLEMLETDHWFASEEVWTAAGLRARPGPAGGLDAFAQRLVS